MAEELSAVHQKGLNLLASPEGMPEEATPDCGNILIGLGGKIATRDGSDVSTLTLPTAAGATAELYVAEETGFSGIGGSQILYTGGKIYRTTNTPSGTDSSPVDIGSYTTTPSALVSERPFATRYTDTLTTGTLTEYTVTTFGVSAPQTLVAGATSHSTVTHPSGDWTTANGFPRVCASYAGRVFYMGSKAFPGRIWISDVGKVATFTTSSPALATDSFVLDLDLITGGRIVSSSHLFNILVVFTSQGAYRIVVSSSATSPFTSEFVTNKALVGRHALVQAEELIYFMTEEGVFQANTALTFGDIQTQEISIPIAPIFKQTAAWKLAGANLVYDRSSKLLYVFVEHDYAFSQSSAVAAPYTQTQADTEMDAGREVFPSGVTEVLVFDTHSASGAWTRFFYPFLIDFAVARDQGNGETALEAYQRTSTTTIKEHELMSPGLTDDAGTAMPSYFRGKRTTFKTFSKRKIRMFLHTDLSSGAVTAKVSTDGGAFTALPDAISEGLSRQAVIGTGKTAQVEYSAASGAWELNSYEIRSKIRGER